MFSNFSGRYTLCSVYIYSYFQNLFGVLFSLTKLFVYSQVFCSHSYPRLSGKPFFSARLTELSNVLSHHFGSCFLRPSNFENHAFIPGNNWTFQGTESRDLFYVFWPKSHIFNWRHVKWDIHEIKFCLTRSQQAPTHFKFRRWYFQIKIQERR